MEEIISISAQEKHRFWELDFLRGFFVILMVIDHLLFSLGSVLPGVWEWCEKEFWLAANEFAIKYWNNMARNIAQMIVSSLFFVLCGISCTLSRNNLKRGLIAAGAALLITIGTFAVRSLTGEVIIFGVIHMLASSILIYYLLSLAGNLIKKAAGKNPSQKKAKIFDWIGRLLPAFIGLVLLIIYFSVPLGHIGIKSGVGNVEFLSDINPKNSEGLNKFLSFFAELKDGNIKSSDYFPLLPHMPLVLLGSGIGQIVYNTRHKYYLRKLDGAWNKPVTYVGRKALIIYIAHQILFISLLFGIGAIFYLRK